MKNSIKGRCFDLTADFALQRYRDPPESTKNLRLVHGLITGQGPIEGILHGHAWLEFNGRVVFDPSYNWFGSVADFYEIARPKQIIKYTLIEAVQAMLEQGHKGPWEPKLLEQNDEAIRRFLARQKKKK